MPDDDNFAELIRRIRSGDAKAALQLIERYAPAIRREARFRLGPSLRPVLDSMDICQSVLGSFFVRMIAGQFELDSPGRLMILLIKMTRNKVNEQARKRREGNLGEYEPSSPNEDPANLVMHKDFLNQFCVRLSEKERVLWERRRQDHSWDEIAAEIGGSSQSLRQQYCRAVKRVAQQLGLEEVL
jgi:RNA polymerase sigma-70 factor (ECF subfamily)